MAVTFTSVGYDTIGGTPYNEISWAKAHPEIGSSLYGVRGAGDWKVSAVSGADRTVSIAAGFGWGCGVIDETTTNDTIQLDTIASGSRWDLIAVRRDWTPTAGVSQFVKINGGSIQAIPGGRLVGRGSIDDQPIALVQVTAGQTQPTAILDLRCWANNGGVVAKDTLVRSYLNQIGSVVFIAGTIWRYALGANDVPEWTSHDPVSSLGTAPSGYSWAGAVTVEQKGTRKHVTVDVNVTRTGASTALSTSFSGLGAIIPTTARGSSPVKYLAVAISGGEGNNILAMASVNPVDGVVSIRSQSAFTWTTGAVMTLNLSYYV